MPPCASPGGLSRRDELETAKRQSMFLVGLVTVAFSLWPTRFILVRDAIIALFMVWVTSRVFDMVAFLDGTWENVPYWVKMLVPVDPNIQIPAPFDCIKSAGHNSLATARLKLHRLAPVAKYGLEGLLAVLVGLLDWFLSQDSKKSLEPEPASGLEQWVSLLVATPPEHDYGRINTSSAGLLENGSSPPQPIAWESCKVVTSLPSIATLSTFRVHMSFCLISREVWESKEIRLVDKFKAGRYWEIGGGRGSEDGTAWSSRRVRSIQAIQVLGLLSRKAKAVSTCQEYFAVLRQNWDYRKISWNDVDFAIILGFLVTGPQATTTCKALFSHFSQMRIDQALIPRRNDAFGLSMAALGATILTGGLATPITAPMIVGGLLPVMDTGSDKSLSPRDAAMWQHREASCQRLLSQFHELRSVFGMPVDPFGQFDF
ncbi:hypothetical protein CMQ_6888 [Grosmannia clavigera kw1407]|uniref:Uncharacterized protein n=1 Tax=Grosmannia clavigera (strain kw1407 / UAMH 11150) TaxID=655863 RepID=F0X7P6_GROCL|nr:uncharacterized protein CMQ_6888 [Grosmannia clavigera kw1407]EFX06567.1 hypothetical protein CMQ_6888 [Grosmannia clavigera kw1407]